MKASPLTPGILGLQAVKHFPGSFVTADDLTIRIQSESPRVRAHTNIKVGFADVEVAMITDLEAKSAVRLSESFDAAAIGDFSLPLRTLRTFSRDIIISYLDEDLLIARDPIGTPEILRRKVLQLSSSL